MLTKERIIGETEEEVQEVDNSQTSEAVAGCSSDFSAKCFPSSSEDGTRVGQKLGLRKAIVDQLPLAPDVKSTYFPSRAPLTPGLEEILLPREKLQPVAKDVQQSSTAAADPRQDAKKSKDLEKFAWSPSGRQWSKRPSQENLFSMESGRELLRPMEVREAVGGHSQPHLGRV